MKYGNEGARQRERCRLPQMSEAYIAQCLNAAAPALRPSGHCFFWVDTILLCEGFHHKVKGVLPCVDLISWDNQAFGNGYRSRRCGGYLVVLQKPPIRAKGIWLDHGIRDHWSEKVQKVSGQPHVKPHELIRRLIGAVTEPGDLVVDPAAGTFSVMHIAHQLGRRFAGCDITYGTRTR